MNSLICPCCASTQTRERPVLWKALIDEWRLSSHEVAYIDRQQGFHCAPCGSNLRSMALARAVMACFAHPGPFAAFVRSEAANRFLVAVFLHLAGGWKKP
jgi:hypothetical protein